MKAVLGVAADQSRDGLLKWECKVSGQKDCIILVRVTRFTSFAKFSSGSEARQRLGREHAEPS